MIFGFFKSKKKPTTKDILGQIATYHRLENYLAKAQSLKKLGRESEADGELHEAQQMVTDYLKRNPHNPQAHMLMGLFYKEVGDDNRAEIIFEELLNSEEFELSDKEQAVLAGELQKIRREKPPNERSSEGPREYTHVYCCQNCGCLHNCISMPCPYCDWSPQTIEQLTRSILLSNQHLPLMQDLLYLSREIPEGREPNDVIPNLLNLEKAYWAQSKNEQAIRTVWTLLRENEHKNHRSIKEIHMCPHCNGKIQVSGQESCSNCKRPLNLPDAVVALICMDNILWWFRMRVDLASSGEIAEFICVLVAMIHNLLRKQEVPSAKQRQYALDSLSRMVSIADLNRGGIIGTQNPKDGLQVYLVRDNMREDSEFFTKWISTELNIFIKLMSQGVGN